MTSTAGPGRPRPWPTWLAWGLWALAMLGLAVVPSMDSLLRQAGRPDLAALVPGSIVGPLLAMLSATTVGAVLASRRPRHPVGWLLLGFALALTASVPMRETILGRALARVIAHEIYHIVADTTEHEEVGLAKAQLSVRELAAERFDLSPASLQRIRAAYRVGPPAIPVVGLISPAAQGR